MNNQRIFLEITDMMKLFGISTYRGAYKRYDIIRATVGKKARQRITIREFCKLEGCTEEEVKQAIF